MNIKRYRKSVAFLVTIMLLFLGIPIGSFAQSDPQAIRATEWSPDGTFVAIGGNYGTLQIYYPNGNLYLNLIGHSVAVSAISWSPDSTRLVSAGSDKIVRVWNIKQAGDTPGRLIQSMTGHIDQIEIVAWSPDGNYIVSASSGSRYDETINIRIWSGTTYSLVKQDSGPNIYNLAWKPDSSQIAFAAYYGTVLMNVADIGVINVPSTEVYVGQSYSVDWNSTGSLLAFGTYNPRNNSETVRIFNTATLTEVATIPNAGILGLTWSPDDRRIAVMGPNGVEVWDTQTQPATLLTTYTTNPSNMSKIGWSPDGTKLAYGNIGFVPVIVTPPQPATTQTTSANLRDLLTHPACERACFMGIEPGVTTRTEIEHILNSQNITYLAQSYGHSTDSDPEAYSWIPDQTSPYINNSDRTHYTIVYFDQITNLVGQIILPIRINLSQVISEYGTPSWILYTQDGVYDLVYPQYGLSFLINNSYGSTTVIKVSLLTKQGIENHFSVEGTATDCSYSETACPAPTATPAP